MYVTSFLVVISAALMLSGCKNAIPQVKFDSSKNPPHYNFTTGTKSSFAAAAGTVSDGSRKIKFTVGYNVQGATGNDGHDHIYPNSAGLLNEK